MFQQVTLKDIAREINISIAAVSKALNNSRETSKETQRLVKETAERMNYQPNRAAQSLVNSKTRTIGVIVPNLGYNYFSTALQGIDEEATKNGYTVIACQSMEELDKEEKIVNNIIRSGVDGIIVSLAQHTKNIDLFRKLKQQKMPMVFFDRVTEELNTSKVIVDNVAGAFGAVEHLVKIGCKRIAYMAGPEELLISKRRFEGYKLALHKYKLPFDESLVAHCVFDHAKSIKAATKLLNSKNPPDGIFAFSDRIALSALQAAKNKNLRVPEDIAIIGFNDEPIASFVSPTLSSVHQPVKEIGEMAARILIEEIENGVSIIPKVKLFKTKLVKRESTKKKKIKTLE